MHICHARRHFSSKYDGMYSRLFQPPKKSFFLFGPRGTGKSTLLKTLFPQAVFFNLLMERQYQKYLADPEIFYNEVQAIPAKSLIVVDEIQRLPSLLNYVHQLIEEKKWTFALTGSSARKVNLSPPFPYGNRWERQAEYGLRRTLKS